jgi:hypothetical protein
MSRNFKFIFFLSLFFGIPMKDIIIILLYYYIIILLIYYIYLGHLRLIVNQKG